MYLARSATDGKLNGVTSTEQSDAALYSDDKK